MFDFLKKKLKESVESIKKVFSEEPEKEEREEPKEEIPEIEELQKEGPVEAEKEILIEEPVPFEEDGVEEEEDKVEDTETIKETSVEGIEKEEAPKTEEQPAEETKTEEQPSEETKTEEPKDEESEVEKKEEIIEEQQDETKDEEKEIEEKKEIIEEQQDETKEEITEELTAELPKEAPKKKSIFEKIFRRKPKEPEEKKEIAKDESKKDKTEISEEKEDFVEKTPRAKPRFLFEKRLSDEEFERFFKTMEITFLEANIAYEVIQLLKSELKKNLVDNPVPRGKVDETIMNTIKDTFEKIMLEMAPQEILDKISEKKKQGMPLSILFLGVNGVGKTTNLCKMGHWLQQKGFSIVLSASDTFRAASIEQLEKHAENLKVKVIKHKYGADPAAVAFDAIEYAKAHEIDCVLIDSAGRQHSNINLMDELAKIKRVAKPDFIIFVADALTGNDAVEQAREFGKIGFDAIILGKADVDQKGGAIFSVSYVSGKPIIFLGVGQGYEDLEAFSREKTVKKLIK